MIPGILWMLAAGLLGGASGFAFAWAHFATKPPRIVFLDQPRADDGRFMKRGDA